MENSVKDHRKHIETKYHYEDNNRYDRDPVGFALTVHFIGNGRAKIMFLGKYIIYLRK
jgi:hypothetical protein